MEATAVEHLATDATKWREHMAQLIPCGGHLQAEFSAFSGAYDSLCAKWLSLRPGANMEDAAYDLTSLSPVMVEQSPTVALFCRAGFQHPPEPGYPLGRVARQPSTVRAKELRERKEGSRRARARPAAPTGKSAPLPGKAKEALRGARATSSAAKATAASAPLEDGSLTDDDEVFNSATRVRDSAPVILLPPEAAAVVEQASPVCSSASDSEGAPSDGPSSSRGAVSATPATCNASMDWPKPCSWSNLCAAQQDGACGDLWRCQLCGDKMVHLKCCERAAKFASDQLKAHSLVHICRRCAKQTVR